MLATVVSSMSSRTRRPAISQISINTAVQATQAHVIELTSSYFLQGRVAPCAAKVSFTVVSWAGVSVEERLDVPQDFDRRTDP